MQYIEIPEYKICQVQHVNNLKEISMENGLDLKMS